LLPHLWCPESLYGIHYSRFLLIFSKGTLPYPPLWTYPEHCGNLRGWAGFIERDPSSFPFRAGKFSFFTEEDGSAEACRRDMAFSIRNMEKYSLWRGWCVHYQNMIGMMKASRSSLFSDLRCREDRDIHRSCPVDRYRDHQCGFNANLQAYGHRHREADARRHGGGKASHDRHCRAFGILQHRQIHRDGEAPHRGTALQGKDTLIVGGTGLYITAMTRGLFSGPSADWGLRDKLLSMEQEAPGSLYDCLKRLDPDAAERIMAGDTRRIIRAIEVYLMIQKGISELQRSLTMPLPYRFIKIGLTKERGELYRSIERRVDTMISRGLVDEVARLYELPLGKTARQAIGYKEIATI